MLALIGRKKMHDHVAKIHDDPAFAGLALLASLFAMLGADCIHQAVRKRIQHTVAGAVGNDEIIGKGCNILDVEQQNIFSFLVFKCVNNGTC